MFITNIESEVEKRSGVLCTPQEGGPSMPAVESSSVPELCVCVQGEIKEREGV